MTTREKGEGCGYGKRKWKTENEFLTKNKIDEKNKRVFMNNGNEGLAWLHGRSRAKQETGGDKERGNGKTDIGKTDMVKTEGNMENECGREKRKWKSVEKVKRQGAGGAAAMYGTHKPRSSRCGNKTRVGMQCLL